MVPLDCDEEELHEQFATNYAGVPEFCGKQFGTLLAKRVEAKLPAIDQLSTVFEPTHHRDFVEIPQLHSFVSLCQPFTAALQDLLVSNQYHASAMLRVAVQAIAKAPAMLPSILCHILFTSFPITSPLVAELATYIRNNRIKLCIHCMEELEQCAYFINGSFSRAGFEVAHFKENHSVELPKIAPLGEPYHKVAKYNSKLLQSTFISQQNAASPTFNANVYELSHQLVGKDFFCGSHSRKRHLGTIFSQKVNLSSTLCCS